MYYGGQVGIARGGWDGLIYTQYIQLCIHTSHVYTFIVYLA